ncbi:MAG: phytanoyl-CoA dioxygenase family protein [Halobacteriaceae archaeon]
MAGTERTDPATPSDLDDYLFDLRGYLVLEDALTDREVAALDETVDDLRTLDPGEWRGHVHRYEGADDGVDLQQIYEAPPFETLIDHPSWIEYVKRFVGNQDDFDAHHGPLYVDENFVRVSPEGQGTPIHSGGHERTKRTQFRYHDGEFHCGQVNVLVALTDFGPGDGGTMVVPGSHKQNFEPPFLEDARGETLEEVPEAEPVRMEAGDAVLFVDSLMHGSATRTNPGERRFAVFRYGPSWGVSRNGYEPSGELLDRLTERQATMVKTWGSVERKSPPEG